MFFSVSMFCAFFAVNSGLVVGSQQEETPKTWFRRKTDSRFHVMKHPYLAGLPKNTDFTNEHFVSFPFRYGLLKCLRSTWGPRSQRERPRPQGPDDLWAVFRSSHLLPFPFAHSHPAGSDPWVPGWAPFAGRKLQRDVEDTWSPSQVCRSDLVGGFCSVFQWDLGLCCGFARVFKWVS